MQPKQVQVLERPGNLMQRLRCELSFFSITVALDNCVFGAFQSSPPQSGFTRASRWEWSKAIRVDNRMWRIEAGRCWAETWNPLHKISSRHQKAIPSSPKALGSSAVSALVKSVNTLQKNWAINIRSWVGGGVQRGDAAAAAMTRKKRSRATKHVGSTSEFGGEICLKKENDKN